MLQYRRHPSVTSLSTSSASTQKVRAIGLSNFDAEQIKDNFALFDLALTEDEMSSIAALDKGVRYYNSTPELLNRYVTMVPPVDEQK